ncbi:tetratricopeptide repeat protein [Fischerella sp. FACHB-380]|uniref:tetratricopeptide repeat protein n=3 Tax=Fischerella TaxID=1190 RepID=UPI0016850DDC|nr:tetratricopeptide repeat protein [Fischerella sp. FACHB-380]MBD2430490.1 tetratricopeptide repeat protein [Fischerella sp. FACHB-380]
MNPDLGDWDEDLPPEPEEAYQDLVRALKRKSGFGLYFVQCTPAEADRLIAKLPQDIPQKHIELLRLVEAIDNLYERVAEFVKDKQVDILLIKGLEYSLYKYEKRTFGEITENKFSDLTSVPYILNHLNQQRERFRDDFPFCFVFLLRSFSINYLIHRAPDFFDWRSGVFEVPTTPELVEQESTRLILSGDYGEYLKLTQEQKIEKVLEFQDLLAEKHQTEDGRASLLFELGNLLVSAKEYEAAIASYDKAVEIKPDYQEAWFMRGIALFQLGRYEEAIASYDKAVEIKPDYQEAWYIRGIALFQLGRYEEAIASYDKAVEIKPDYQEAWYIRGIALRQLGRYEEAIASYDKALEIKPDYHQAWYNKACCYALQVNIEQAIENLQKAIILNPECREMAKTDSDFDSIRDDERFQELIEQEEV